MSAPIVSVRRVLHPGKPRPDRVAAAVGVPRRALAWLPEGLSLHAAVVGAFAAMGAEGGSFELLGGVMAVAAYHVTGPTESRRVADYGPPTVLSGAVRLIHATGSFGLDLSGVPMVHIHGSFADADGRARGSHVNQHESVIGPGGVRAVLVAGPGYRQIDDRETLFPLFFPFAEAGS
jgi:predicted DNA-binding protein with PD1-like motif